jgi:O-antigen/teichoic acid export membrane protein
VVANYAGQAYTVLAGVVMLPFYLEFLGAEAYGLVGFFALLHAWLSLLTAGFSPTLARQVSHHHALGQLGSGKFREVLRSLELLVGVIAVVTAFSVWMGSDWLAGEWLRTGSLAHADVAHCITLMGLIVGMRWGVALYSGGLNGLEHQVWLNGFNMVFATLRFGAAYVLLRWVTHDPVHYFEFQLAVSLIELAWIARRFYQGLPGAGGVAASFSWPALRDVLPFTAGVAYTSMLWVLITQSDKLILSHVLTLAEYGFFALVALIANGVLQFSSPIQHAVSPRLTQLFTQGREQEMVALYRKTTQFVVVVVAAVSGMLAMFPRQTLFVLTGSDEAAGWGAQVLPWFALGNGILVVAGMQFVLQYAHGKLKMHVYNTTINALIQVPVLVYVALNHGVLAVAVAWFVIRLLAFLVWPALVHRTFLPGKHGVWLWHDVCLPVIGTFAGLFVLKGLLAWMAYWPDSRMGAALALSVSGVLVLVAGALGASEARRMLQRGMA